MSETLEQSNYGYLTETIEMKKDLEYRFLDLGQRLHRISKERLFAPTYETFAEYCQELKMSNATVSKLMNIYQKFILEYGIDKQLVAGAGGWSAVAETLAYVKNKDDALMWLEKATTLRRSDLRKEMGVASGKRDQDDCEHDTKWITVKRCRECGISLIIDEK